MKTAAELALIVPLLAILTTGCAREVERGPQSEGSIASGSGTSGSGRALRPVSLPDLSRDADSVQEQVRTAYSSLTRVTEQPGVPVAKLATAYGEMGMLLMAAELGEAAEPCLLNAKTLAPQDRRWSYYLAHLYKDQGAGDKATASFEEALRLGPDDVATLVWLGESYLTQDRPDPAREKFERALSLQPRSAAALTGLGRVFMAKREYSTAVKYLEEARALNSEAAVIHYSLAMAYRGLGDLARAETYLRNPGKAETLVPDPLMQAMRGMLRSARAYETQGITALERGDLAAAADYFRQGVDLAPENASLHHRLGTALLLGGDLRAGQEQFEAALRLDPNFARAHYSLAVLMASRGLYPQAIERLSAAVTADPGYVEALLLLGSILRDSGRLEEALRRYGQAIKVDAGAVEAHLGHALTLVRLGRYRQALDELTAAAKTRPDQPDLVQARARLLAAAPDAGVRNGAQAVVMMQAIAAQHRTPELDETMAMAYAESGDYQQAVAWQRGAIEAAQRSERAPHVRQQMIENLRLFERGQPCRIPWRDGTMP